MNDLNAMPKGLSKTGQKAYRAIMAKLKQANALDTGGCRTFYSPAEWQARGEDYGCNSELIVVYDGGDVRPFFSYDEECYSLIENMRQALEAKGVYSEQCTTWYSAVYDN